MNKKAISPIIIVLGVIVILSVVGGAYYYGVVPNVVLPSGCQQIGETKQVSSSFFRCEAEQCVVQAVMKVEKPTGINIAQCGNFPKTWDSVTSCISDVTYRTSVGCSSQNCKLVQRSIYEADWKFCPSSNLNFAHCNGNQAKATGNIEHFSTEEILLGYSGTLTFEPKYPDGSAVQNKYLLVKEYDCTCTQEIIQGEACDPSSNEVYCSPIGSNTCPNGKRFYAAGTTYADYSISQNCLTLERDSCAKYGGYNVASCNWGPSLSQVEPVGVTNNKYYACNTPKPNSICTMFGDTLQQCPGNQICYVNGNKNDFGPGVGVCGYPNDQCTPGAYTGTRGSNSYRKCENVGGYYNWVDKNCDPELSFDPDGTNDQSVCVCNNECVPGELDCASYDSQENCISYKTSGILSKTCWKIENEPCSGDQKCNGGQCSCDYTYSNKCTTIGQTVCRDDSSFSTCAYEIGNSKSCPKLRYDLSNGYGGDCEISEKCDNGNCVPRTDVGCSYVNKPTQTIYESTYKCSTVKDSNNLNIEVCDSNICIPTQDIFIATVDDFIGSKTACYNGDVYEVKEYETRDNTIYRWELKEECAGVTPVCFGDELQ